MCIILNAYANPIFKMNDTTMVTRAEVFVMIGAVNTAFVASALVICCMYRVMKSATKFIFYALCLAAVGFGAFYATRTYIWPLIPQIITGANEFIDTIKNADIMDKLESACPACTTWIQGEWQWRRLGWRLIGHYN